MKDPAAEPQPTHRVHLPSWAWFCACFGAAIEVLDGRLLYGAHPSPWMWGLTIFGLALLGMVVGAVVGLLLGTIAQGVEPFLREKMHRRRRYAQIDKPVRFAWLIGLAFGVVVGGYNVMSSSYKISHDRMVAACERVAGDLDAGQSELDSHHSSKGRDYALAALHNVPACKLAGVAADEAQAHLLLAIAGYQSNLPYLAEAHNAEDLANACARRYSTPADVVGARCRSIVLGAQAALTQQFCDASLRQSNSADDSIAHSDYGLGHQEAEEALQSAGKCKNPYAYAYRGMALLKRGMADYLAGQKAGVKDISAAKQLLDRCVDELDDSPNKELRKNCRFQLSVAKPMIEKPRS